MKKSFVVMVIMCLTSMVVSAQWKVDSVGYGEPSTKLLQVLKTDNSVLVYATMQRQCAENKFVNLNRNIHAKVNGMKYKLLNAVNMPIGDEAENRFAVLNNGKNKINFVMEFEKFPIEEGFDIIESEKEGDFCFNFYGVEVSRIDPSEVIDTDRFLDDGTPVITGKDAKDGTQYLYYIRDGLCITCNAERQDGEWFTDYEVFHIDIVNDSDHGVMFDFDAVSVVGNKKNSDGTMESKPWKKFSPDRYDELLASREYEEARQQSSNVLDEVGRQINRERYNTKVNSWARLGWAALGAINEHAIQNRVAEYMKNHPKDLPRALRTESIKAGESLHGYVASKTKRADEVVLTLPIDGYDFKFTFRLK